MDQTDYRCEILYVCPQAMLRDPAVSELSTTAFGAYWRLVIHAYGAGELYEDDDDFKSIVGEDWDSVREDVLPLLGGYDGGVYFPNQQGWLATEVAFGG